MALEFPPFSLLHQFTAPGKRPQPDPPAPARVAKGVLEGWPPQGTVDLALSNVAGLTYREFQELGLSGLPAEMNLGDPSLGITPALKEAVAARHGLGGQPERVVVTNGTSEGNFLIMAALVGQGRYTWVIVEDPTYPPLANLPAGFGAQVVKWRRGPERDFQVDLEGLAGLLEASREPPLVVLTNLHNPSGAPMGRTEMEQVAELVGNAGGLLVVDEIYRELEPGVPSVATLGDHCLAGGSVSKVYGVSGLRVGWIVGAPEVLAPVAALKEYVSAVNSSVCELLALQALLKGNVLVERARAIKAANAPLVEDFCRVRGELTWHPSASLVAFVGVDHHLGSLELARRLREDHGVLVSAGEHFGWPGFLRLGFGCHPEALEDRLSAFGEALDALAPN